MSRRFREASRSVTVGDVRMDFWRRPWRTYGGGRGRLALRSDGCSLWGRGWVCYSSDHFDVCGTGAVVWNHGVYDSEDVPLHHADKVEVVLLLGRVAEVLDEVHDVCSVVHGVLASYQVSGYVSVSQRQYLFELLEDARV